MTRDEIRRLALEVEHALLSAGWNASTARAAFVAVIERARIGDEQGWMTLISEEIEELTP
jgi:hypothetical protein